MRGVLMSLATVLLVGLLSPAVLGAEEPAVDAAVQVTGDPDPFRAYASPVVAVDPGNERNIVIARGEARSAGCGLELSTNGGLSWSRGASPLPADVAGCVRNTNGPIADLVFAPDGTLYYAFAGYPDRDDFHSQIYVARSTDLGRSFQTTVVPGLDAPYAEDIFGTPALPTLGLDPSDPQRLYVAFQANYGLFSLADGVFPEGKFSSSYPLRAYVARSDDGGVTFAEPVAVSNDPKDHASRAYLVVGADGALYVFAGEVNTPVPFGSGNPPPAPRIFLSISTDGGQTFDQQVIHTSAPGAAGDSFAVLLGLSPAVDLGTGALYLAWEDTGLSPPAILFSSSSDNGVTWSEPVQVNDVDPQRDWDFNEEEPALSVAPDGRIDLAWLDYRNDITFVPGSDAGNALQDVYLSSSTDGGKTWSANLRVTDRSIDRRLSDVHATGVHSAVGLHATNSGAYVAWDDTRNATADSAAQDVYFTRVRLRPNATLVGTSAGAGTSTNLVWGIGGAAIAFALAGIALLLSRSPSRAPSAAAGRSTAKHGPKL